MSPAPRVRSVGTAPFAPLSAAISGPSPSRQRGFTPDEERDLGERIQVGRAAHALLMRSRRLPPRLRRLLRQLADDGLQARDAMVAGNQALAHAYLPRHAPPDERADHLQAALDGLRRAAEKFDPRRACRFSTYAVWWIIQAVQRSMRTTTAALRLPAYVYEYRRWIIDTLHDATLRRRPTFYEDAAHAVQQRIIDHARRHHRAPPRVVQRFSADLMRAIDQSLPMALSLDRAMRADDDLRLIDCIASPAPDPADLVQAREEQAMVRRAIAQLPDLDRQVIVLRYFDQLSPAAAARQLGIDDGRLLRVETSALERLRLLLTADDPGWERDGAARPLMGMWR